MAYLPCTLRDAVEFSRSVILSRSRTSLAALLLIAPAFACTLKITDFQSSESESGDTTAASSSSGGSTGESAGTESGGTTGTTGEETESGTDSGVTPEVPEVPEGLDCDPIGATAEVSLSWSVDDMICESEEVCDAVRSMPCTVEAIDAGETIEVSFACQDPELGEVSATLGIETSAPSELDLVVGEEVTLEERHIIGFEVIDGRTVRLIDEAGELVVASVRVGEYGGSTEHYDWEGPYVQETVAPMTAEVLHFVCGGDPWRGAVRLAQLDEEVWVASGDERTLAGDGLWSVTVETATRWSIEPAHGTIDLVVVRVKP